MKKFFILGVVLVTILVSLGGCCGPRFWHDGYRRAWHDDGYGRGRYDNHRGGGHYERR